MRPGISFEDLVEHDSMQASARPENRSIDHCRKWMGVAQIEFDEERSGCKQEYQR